MTRRIVALTPMVAGLMVACSEEAPRIAPRRDDALRPVPAVATMDAGIRDAGIRDAGPPARIYASRFRVNIHEEPAFRSKTIGYLRSGAEVRATTAEPVSRESCPGGWFRLNPAGYVCHGRGVEAIAGDARPAPPIAQPDLDAPLPYRYGRIGRDRVPFYRRMPTDEEAAEFEGYRIPGAVIDAGTPPTAPPGEIPPPPAVVVEQEQVPEQGQGQEQGQEQEQEQEQEEEVVVDAGVTLESLAGEEGGVVRRWLMRGFYVSIDTETETGRRSYVRTLDNGFIPRGRVAGVDGSDFAGIALDGETMALPVGFVLERNAAAFSREEARGRVRAARAHPARYHFAFRITGEEEIGRQRYYVASDGLLYRTNDVTRVDPRPVPSDAAPGERWIDVNLANQSLVAYEGDRPVYVTLISSGRRSRPSEPEDFETPTGTFRIASKHITHRMDGDTAIDGPYSIDDVPYVMYFRLAYAFHTAFWHDSFGRRKSHGCVNLSPRDSRWLFDWAGPALPPSWHGVFPTDENPGTLVVVRDE